MNDNTSQPQSPNTDKKSTAKFFNSMRIGLLITSGFFIVLIAALLIWKNSEIASLKKESKKKEALIKQRADEVVELAHLNHLKLLAKPYVWAIRTEIMKGNIEAVNLYSNDMVKEKNFKAISVVNDKGIIISSTDKKLEGAFYSIIGKEQFLKVDSTISEKINENTILVSSPVMGFNKRLGTLILLYTIQKNKW